MSAVPPSALFFGTSFIRGRDEVWSLMDRWSWFIALSRYFVGYCRSSS